MKTHNITELMENYTFLLEDKEDVIFAQECKIKDEEKGRIEAKCREENYDLVVGRSCNDTKRPSAGVGCASAMNKVEMVITKNITE